MNASRTARERARIELTREIKDEARRQLAADGVDQLSLRGVARELGMVSSALYRYFPSRDDLLTALIIDAYDAIGSAAEQADTSCAREDLTARWRGACRAVREWARAHPREYALIYGSTIPGYQAPRDTVTPASRVPLVLVGVIRDAWAADRLTVPTNAPTPPAVLTDQLNRLATTLEIDGVPEPAMTRTIIAWSQLFGMVSFELTGQFVGSVDPTDAFFEQATAEMATFVGLPA